jgi:hypothetical protein
MEKASEDLATSMIALTRFDQERILKGEWNKFMEKVPKGTIPLLMSHGKGDLIECQGVT